MAGKMDNKNTGIDIAGLQEKYVLKTYSFSPPIIFVKGAGAYLKDSTGKRYLDFSSGISVCNLGHCHPAVTAAIRRQAGKLVHVSNLFMNSRQPELAWKLVSHCFDGAAFFCNSGAEANEGLIKFARKWGNPTGRNEIIVMKESFHGRTLATLAATGRSKYREGFQPDMPGFVHVLFNDFEAAASAVGPRTAAIMLEPVQGEGGVIPADKAYLEKIRKLCDEKGILLLFDEVQCGMGRTGSFFAWQSYGVGPDGLSLAKALGNGFPIGAFILKRKFENVLVPGTHASTFGGTALACAAACAVIDAIDRENILLNCSEQSVYLMRKLGELAGKYTAIRSIRGRGLMIGLVLDVPASEIRKVASENGLLVLTAGDNVLRLLPPLTISVKETDKAIKILDKCFKKVKGS